MMFDKLEVARSQLGAALHLFIENADPVSVHVLAHAGSELTDALAQRAGKQPFEHTAREANSELSPELYRKLKSQWANALKHHNRTGGKERDDTELLATFSDETNDLMLFIGWYDYGLITAHKPIEAQVFEAWWFSKVPEKLHPNAVTRGWGQTFPNISSKPLAEQKDAMRRMIVRLRKNRSVMEDPRTEHRKLVLPNNLANFTR